MLLDTPDSTHSSIRAQLFLTEADALVDRAEAERRGLLSNHPGPDDVLEFLRRRHPAPVRKAQPAPCRTLPLPSRPAPQIGLGNIRFGRTRLFLSKFLGDRAWRGWRAR